MRLSTKGRYAVTAMLDLALNGTQGPVTLADISENQGSHCPIWSSCSPPCAAKTLVRGVRGPAAVTISVAIPTRSRSPISSAPSMNGWSSRAARVARIARMDSAASHNPGMT